VGAVERAQQFADGEIGRVALARIAVFATEMKRRQVRHRKTLTPIAAGVEDRFDQAVVRIGQSAEQDRGGVALAGGKRPFNGAAIVAGNHRVPSGSERNRRAFQLATRGQ
jgi:hypothetical protein